MWTIYKNKHCFKHSNAFRKYRNMRAAGAWVTELPSVLWGLRTTPNRSIDQTPFFMMYGAEAVLLSDLLHNAPRVELFS